MLVIYRNDDANGRITQVTSQRRGYEAQRMDLVSPKHIDMPEYR